MTSVLVNNEIHLLIYDYIKVKPQISCYIYLRIILFIESNVLFRPRTDVRDHSMQLLPFMGTEHEI